MTNTGQLTVISVVVELLVLLIITTNCADMYRHCASVLLSLLLYDVSVLKLHDLMPHHRAVQFRRDQQLMHSDKLMSMTPFIYSPLHLSPAKNDGTCTEHGCTISTAALSYSSISLFLSIYSSGWTFYCSFTSSYCFASCQSSIQLASTSR